MAGLRRKPSREKKILKGLPGFILLAGENKTFLARLWPNFPRFGRVIHQIGQMHRSGKWEPRHSQGLRRMLGPAFSPETIQGMQRLDCDKPHGYAGDYEIIDRMMASVARSPCRDRR